MKKQYMDSNDWDGDESQDSGAARSRVFSSPEKRLFYLYGEINARNCADIAYDISVINYEDDEKDDKERWRVCFYMHRWMIHSNGRLLLHK